MKTKIKIAVIAMMGISFGVKAQIQENKTLSLSHNSSMVGDLISLYGNRLGLSNMYGFGIESRGGVLYNKSVNGYNWYLNTNANNGTGAIMRLNSKGLLVNNKIGAGTLDPKVRLHLEEENKGSRTSVKDLLYLSSRHSSVGYNGFGTGIVDFRRTYQNSTPHAINRISFIERGHSTADRGGAITFATKQLSSGSAAPVERLRIDYNGNVGIGTTDPGAKLHINNVNNSYGAILANASERKFSLYTKTLTTQPANIESFRLGLKYDTDERNGFISFYRGTGTAGGFLGFSTFGEERMRISSDGNVGIGTQNPGIWQLAVNGKIRAKEIKVETGWSDFVFYDDYKLPTLEEVENHIKEKGHLKDIPSAKEVEENGVFLGEMDSKLLQKIEELTLYTIDQDKEIKVLKNENKLLKSLLERVSKLEKEIKQLK